MVNKTSRENKQYENGNNKQRFCFQSYKKIDVIKL